MAATQASPGPEASSEPARLRQAEVALARIQGELGTQMGERVARLEEAQKSFATKEDLERAKRWGLTALFSALLSLLILQLRLLSWIWSK